MRITYKSTPSEQAFELTLSKFPSNSNTTDLCTFDLKRGHSPASTTNLICSNLTREAARELRDTLNEFLETNA